MARYTGAVCKLCRREGKKLFLKGDRCYTGKCSLERRSYAPGQHGQSRKKNSEYGLQLRAKQTAKRYYGIQEGQFHKYFLMAERRQGQAGENLLRICESRLDNAIYLLGWASSRAEARQLVRHGHITVNGKKVNIPSYLVSVGDVIAVKEASKDHKAILESLEKINKTVEYVEFDKKKLSGTYVRYPERSELPADIKESMIVEFYSK